MYNYFNNLNQNKDLILRISFVSVSLLDFRGQGLELALQDAVASSFDSAFFFSIFC